MSKKRIKFIKGDVVTVELNVSTWIINWIYPPDAKDGDIFIFVKTKTVNQDWGSWYKGKYFIESYSPKRIHTFLDQKGELVEFGNSGKKIKIISRVGNAQKNINE